MGESSRRESVLSVLAALELALGAAGHGVTWGGALAAAQRVYAACGGERPPSPRSLRA
jgi:hypothetical protein